MIPDAVSWLLVTYASGTLAAPFNFYREVYRMRVKITLVCSECKQRNYDSTKNKKNDPDRLEFKKYCKFCRKHTLHKESK